jgi:hypothetical protein
LLRLGVVLAWFRLAVAWHRCEVEAKEVGLDRVSAVFAGSSP